MQPSARTRKREVRARKRGGREGGRRHLIRRQRMYIAKDEQSATIAVVARVEFQFLGINIVRKDSVPACAFQPHAHQAHPGEVLSNRLPIVDSTTEITRRNSSYRDRSRILMRGSVHWATGSHWTCLTAYERAALEGHAVDTYGADTRSHVMRAVRSKDTTPELRVRRLLHAAGYRFRVHVGGLPAKPDLAFTRRRKAVLVHGCFWHQHPGCRAAGRPSSNREYWDKKLDGNVRRDQSALSALNDLGWDVLIVWECETPQQDNLRDRLVAFLGPPRCPARQPR